jgi:hypothetical protein
VSIEWEGVHALAPPGRPGNLAERQSEGRATPSCRGAEHICAPGSIAAEGECGEIDLSAEPGRVPSYD